MALKAASRLLLVIHLALNMRSKGPVDVHVKDFSQRLGILSPRPYDYCTSECLLRVFEHLISEATFCRLAAAPTNYQGTLGSESIRTDIVIPPAEPDATMALLSPLSAVMFKVKKVLSSS